MHVRVALPDGEQHVEIEVEQFGFAHVAEAAAVADHRVVFVRLHVATGKVGEFVGA